MISRGRYLISRRSARADYRNILELACDLSDYFALVVEPNPWPSGDYARRILSELQGQEVAQEQVRAWPGAELVPGEERTRVLYRANSGTLNTLLLHAQSLHDWVRF